MQVSTLPDHVEYPGVVEHEVLKLDRSQGNLAFATLLQLKQFVLEHAKPRAGLRETVSHREDEVTAGLQDPEDLFNAVWVDLAGSEAVGRHDDVVYVVHQGQGPQAAQRGEYVHPD